MARVPRTTLLAAIRECVTVVAPGEVLAVRIGDGTSDDELADMGERAMAIADQDGVRIVLVRGEEFARLRSSGAVSTEFSGSLTPDLLRALRDEIRRRGGDGPDSVQRVLGSGS